MDERLKYKLKKTKWYVSHISQYQVFGLSDQIFVNEGNEIKVTYISWRIHNDVLYPGVVFIPFHTHWILTVILQVLQFRKTESQRGFDNLSKSQKKFQIHFGLSPKHYIHFQTFLVKKELQNIKKMSEMAGSRNHCCFSTL